MKGSGRDLGTFIRMAPGPDGGLYVSVPGRGGDVLTLLGSSGTPRLGWPILLPGVEACDLLLPVFDGSVRIICAETPPADEDGLQALIERAFAFGPDGRRLDGWPVDTDEVMTARMVGDGLRLIVRPYAGDVPVDENIHMAVIGPDGNVQNGVDIPFGCCETTIGPDGIGYISTHRDWAATGLADVKTDLLAIGLEGPRFGWPVTIDGNASDLASGADGGIRVVVGSPEAGPTRLMVFNEDGQLIQGGSGDLGIVSTNAWDGAGAEYPGSPIVAGDGTSFIVSTESGRTAVLALDPGGSPLAGWPYRSKLSMAWTGFCGAGDTGCGHMRTMPAVDGDNDLYLLQAAATSSTGGRMVAIGSDGRVREGWPVVLRKPGSMFWSMVVGDAGRVWALAIEPEKHGYSATILAIAEDSTVLHATTIVEP